MKYLFLGFSLFVMFCLRGAEADISSVSVSTNIIVKCSQVVDSKDDGGEVEKGTATNSVVEVKTAARIQCHSATASGLRCKRKAVANGLYCRQHIAAEKKSCRGGTCGFIGDDGVRCSSRVDSDERFCSRHMIRKLPEKAKGAMAH